MLLVILGHLPCRLPKAEEAVGLMSECCAGAVEMALEMENDAAQLGCPEGKARTTSRC